MTPVYQFTMYDILTDTERRSLRWATHDAINRIGGHLLEDTMIHIDDALLGNEIAGMTDRGFNPNMARSRQKQASHDGQHSLEGGSQFVSWEESEFVNEADRPL